MGAQNLSNKFMSVYHLIFEMAWISAAGAGIPGETEGNQCPSVLVKEYREILYLLQLYLDDHKYFNPSLHMVPVKHGHFDYIYAVPSQQTNMWINW